MSDAQLFPVNNPTASYWRSEPHQLDSHRSTPDLPNTCDVAVIGAGMSGVSVAYHITCKAAAAGLPMPSIVLIEGRQLCSGATGRNGGHVKIKTKSWDTVARNHGTVHADALARLSHAHITAYKEVVERERLDCEFELRRTYDVFLNETEVEGSRRRYADMAASSTGRLGQQLDRVPDRFVETLTAVRGAKAAVSGPACSLWPYRFVSQLLERTMQKNTGLNLQTETMVTAVEEAKDDDGGRSYSIVRTSRGDLRASKVVFATNAYTAALLPQYRDVITPFKGTAAHLAPPEGQGPVFPHLSHTYNVDFGLRPDAETTDYINPRPDGGVVLGGASWLYRDKRPVWFGSVDDSTLFDEVAEADYFEGYMQRNFRGWEKSDTRVDKVWTGIMGATPDGLPHVGKVPNTRSQWLLAGFNGGGMTQIFLLANAVAEMVATGSSFEESADIVPRLVKATAERLAKKFET